MFSKSELQSGKVHSVKCCKCMSPAMVCIKCSGSTKRRMSPCHFFDQKRWRFHVQSCCIYVWHPGWQTWWHQGTLSRKKMVSVVSLVSRAGVMKTFCSTRLIQYYADISNKTNCSLMHTWPHWDDIRRVCQRYLNEQEGSFRLACSDFPRSTKRSSNGKDSCAVFEASSGPFVTL